MDSQMISIRKIRATISSFIHRAQLDSIVLRRARLERLYTYAACSAVKSIAGKGFKVCSQSDEDGVINEIYKRIGFGSKYFVEFGVGDGLENNTAALLFSGWSGLWIEGSKSYFDKICTGMQCLILSGRLKIVNGFVSPDNIDEIISANKTSDQVDLLSVDIDGNDAHVLERIKSISPRVIVLEYNAKFGPSISFCMKYDREHV